MIFRCVYTQKSIYGWGIQMVFYLLGPPFCHYVKSNGGNFWSNFSIRFLVRLLKNITNRITDWIGFVIRSFVVFVVKHRNEYQKWQDWRKRRRRKNTQCSTSGRLDVIIGTSIYIIVTVKKTDFADRNNSNHNQNHSRMRNSVGMKIHCDSIGFTFTINGISKLCVFESIECVYIRITNKLVSMFLTLTSARTQSRSPLFHRFGFYANENTQNNLYFICRFQDFYLEMFANSVKSLPQQTIRYFSLLICSLHNINFRVAY